MNGNETLVDAVFDNYRLIKVVGEGELGVVYLAQHQENGSSAACKILRPELAVHGSAIQQCVYEAKIAANLDHPNIIWAIPAGASSGYYYFLMEYVEGCSLESLRLNAPEMLSLEFLCARFAELADALDHAWRNHLLTHGDIKPENILISLQDKKLKLADLATKLWVLRSILRRSLLPESFLSPPSKAIYTASALCFTNSYAERLHFPEV